MEHNVYWLSFWSICCSVVLAIAGLVFSADLKNDQMFERMVKAGNDPVELVCARDIVSDSPSSTCVQYVLAKKNGS